MASTQTIAFVAVMSFSGVAIAGLSLKGEPPRRLKFDAANSAHLRVTAPELADWLIEGRRDFAIVDMRGDADHARGAIRDAVHCGSCHEDKDTAQHAQEDHFVDLSKKLVLYTQTGKESLQLPKIIARNPRLYFLEGGYEAWSSSVMAPVKFDVVTGEQAMLDLRRREARRAFFAGEGMKTGEAAQLPVTPIRRQNAHQAAVAREGC
jgi:rhodanese-related sulfurtransferase